MTSTFLDVGNAKRTLNFQVGTGLYLSTNEAPQNSTASEAQFDSQPQPVILSNNPAPHHRLTSRSIPMIPHQVPKFSPSEFSDVWCISERPLYQKPILTTTHLYFVLFSPPTADWQRSDWPGERSIEGKRLWTWSCAISTHCFHHTFFYWGWHIWSLAQRILAWANSMK